MNRRYRIIATVLALSLVLAGCDSQTGGSHALDLEGRRIEVLPATSTNAVALIFVATQCPIANRYVPEIKRLQESFASNGVSFYLVYPDPDATPADIREHMHSYDLNGTPLRDPKHNLVRLAQAQVTPEAAVFLGTNLLYHGRIDDRYPAFGVDRGAPTERNLEQALDAVTKGQATPMQSKPAVGCVIPK